MENETKEKRRLTLFPGMKVEDNDLIGFQNNLNKGILNYEGNSERTRNSTITNKPNSSNIRDNKTRKLC